MDTITRIQLLPNGDLLLLNRRKGSNPEQTKHPAVKCPVCKKYLYSLYNADTKNDTMAYDADDPKYKDYPRNHVCKCPKCHHTIGIWFLSVQQRKKLHLPLRHECHKKITIA